MRISIPVIVVPAEDGHHARFLAAAFRGAHCYGATPEGALEAARDHVAKVLQQYDAPSADPMPLGGSIPKAGPAQGGTGDPTQIVVEFPDRLPMPEEARGKIPETSETGTKPGYWDRIKLVRDRHPRAYERWNEAEEDRLRHLRDQGRNLKQISKELQRQPGAVRSRLDKLGLTERPPSTGTAGNGDE